MTIARGDRIPSVPIKLVGAADTVDVNSDTALGQGLVVFFTVPGAFTPTCDTSHLPGFVANVSKLTALGVDRVVCGTVNDHHVVRAWAERSGAIGKIEFIADGEGNFADALGLAKQMSGMGKRLARCAMIIQNGVVRDLFVQDVSGVTVSGAPAILMALEAAKVTA